MTIPRSPAKAGKLIEGLLQELNYYLHDLVEIVSTVAA